jgi:hypothetical protein
MSEALIFSEGILADSQVAFDEGRKLDVVRNVLLAGNRSKNGYDLPPSAFGSTERVKQLYEGVPVHVNHRMDQGTSRDVESLAGMVANARLVDGKPRGDILLNSNRAGDELRSIVKLSERAQGKLRHIGLSHVASYKFAASRTSVESVLSIFSVDLVIGPATTNSLYESSVSDPKPFNVHDALKFVDYPEYMGADWNPEKALEALGKWGMDFDVEAALKLASPTYSPQFDPAHALNGVTFT